MTIRFNKKSILKIISVLVAVSIALTSFVVPASALGVTATLIIGGVLALCSCVAAGIIAEGVSQGVEDVYNWNYSEEGRAFHQHMQDLYTQDDLLQIELDSNNNPARVVVNSSLNLNSDDYYIAQNIADMINSSGNFSQYVWPITGSPNYYEVNAVGYGIFKEAAVNTYIEAINQKCQEDTGKLIFALNDNLGGTPMYSFDFVGPTPQINNPLYSSVIMDDFILKNGFQYTKPLPVDRSTWTPALTNQISSFFDRTNGYNGNYTYYIAYKSCYTFGRYYLSASGDIYFYPHKLNYGLSEYNCNLNACTDYNPGYTVYDVDGIAHNLGDINAVSIGFYSNNIDPSSPNYPSEIVLSDNDFSHTEGGGDFIMEVPRTPGETAVGNAIQSGLVSENPVLTIDNSGNITAVDGIPIEKLQQLIDKLLASENVNLSTIEGYLQLISTLVNDSNLTAEQQKAILDGVNAKIGVLSGDVSSIKELLQSIAAAKAAEADLDTDYSRDDINLNFISVEHHGLIEAETIVHNALPVVEQMKTLVLNLFNSSTIRTSPPNFSFYWDSNKDGVVEKYTAIDFSFMEKTLTNSNLEDKTLFSTPITVREFFQSLVILVFYVLFAIKVLKKIPSLIGGVDGFEGDINTKNKYGG